MERQVITKEALKKVLADYWKVYKRYPFASVTAFVLPAVGTVLVYFVPPLIVGKIIDAFAREGRISLDIVAVHLALFAGSWGLGEGIWRVGLHFLIKIEGDGITSLSEVAFKRLMKRDYDFFVNSFVGTLTKKAGAFARNFESFTDTLVFSVTTNLFPFIFVVVILWGYSPLIPSILIFFLLLVIILALPIIRRRSKLTALRHDAGSKVTGRFSDSMTNILAVKSFAKEKEEARIYSRFTDDFNKKFKKAANYHNLRLDMMLAPVYVITNVVGLAMAIYFAAKYNLQVGAIVVIFSYYALITKIFWEINRTYRGIESSLNESAEFTQMLLAPPAIQDVKNAKRLEVKKATIDFEKVNFKYPLLKDEDSFLQNFQLHIKDKEKVGLVGPSGGGKTTITKLILRFIDTDSGVISVDGQDIKKVTQSSLREAISYVPQEPLLFHRTLFENIAYGNEKATKRDVANASKIAHADEFISKLPEGYDTLVGERGVKLSGGQRQRVAIARALLKKSPILVLDEATSSLDSESEKYIQEGLWELMKDKTALVIAHRLSTIKHLDRIIVLDDGEIVQDGTHDELIRQKGMYAKLWGHQTGEKESIEEALLLE